MASPRQLLPTTFREAILDSSARLGHGASKTLQYCAATPPTSNDANEGGSSLTNYAANMTTMIQKILAAGKIPVLRRRIPYGCTSAIKTNGPSINTKLSALLVQFPQAVAGPDEWTYFHKRGGLRQEGRQ
jgi:hypothetical protein